MCFRCEIHRNIGCVPGGNSGASAGKFFTEEGFIILRRHPFGRHLFDWKKAFSQAIVFLRYKAVGNQQDDKGEYKSLHNSFKQLVVCIQDAQCVFGPETSVVRIPG